MKISLNWLTDYVDVSMPATELAARLMEIGLPCEEIIETAADVVLDVEITSNRPDCLGHLGIAREVAAATGAEFRPPKRPEPPTTGKVADLAAVDVRAPDLCPRYTARVIRGVKIGASPAWLVERLEAMDLRSVNNVVDATNYVLMEYSQPLHAFDHDKLAGGRIVVRRATGGELITSIDGTRCELSENMLVIADAEKPVAVAGIMGGVDTEVTGDTVNVLIESAQFDPLSIRRTSRRLQLASESNYRFERGVDPVGVDAASLRACELILKLAGGKLAAGVVDVWAAPYEAPRVSLRPGRTDELLGVSIPADRQFKILDNLGLSPAKDGERIVCTIPSHRADLRREADLIEEVARMAGYDEIPVAQTITHPVSVEQLPQRVRRELGEAMAACGFDEAMTFTFVDPKEAEMFGFPHPVAVDTLTRKTNNILRPTLLASLLSACKTNQDAGSAEVSLFELASVFPPGEGELPSEQVELAVVTSGPLEDLRGAIETVIARIAGDPRVDVVASQPAGFVPGRAGEIRLDDETVGQIGCVGNDVQDYYGLERAMTAATLRFDALLERGGKRRTYDPLPRFPSVERDLSLIVDETVTWGQLSEAIRSVAQPMRVAVEYVTTYRGKPVPDGRKSVTAAVTYRRIEGTLRSEQVDQQVAEVVAELEKQLGAELRT